MTTIFFKQLAYKTLYKKVSALPLRIISENGRPYLERYYVTTLFGLYRVYVHRFVGSDPQRGWHDHPWSPAISVVLWGEYGEERAKVNPEVFAQRGRAEPAVLDIESRIVRWFNRLTHGVAHRVVIGDDWTPLVDNNGTDLTPTYKSTSPECWSLFIHRSKYTTGWGFWTATGVARLYTWLSFTGRSDTTVVTSGDWWETSAPAYKNSERLPPLY